MSVESVLAFWVVSFLLVLTPGADWAYAIAAGLRGGTVLPAVGGLLAGHLAHLVVVTAGVAAVLSRSAPVLTILTVAGAGYLAWLGIQTLRAASGRLTPSEPAPQSWQRQAATGFGISGLNPKVFLLFLALLPQFTDPDGRWSLAMQILVLGLLHVASCALVYAGVGKAARAVLRTRPTRGLSGAAPLGNRHVPHRSRLARGAGRTVERQRTRPEPGAGR